MRRKKLCCCVIDITGSGVSRCNRVALIRLVFQDNEIKNEYDICDKHFNTRYWFYNKPVVHSWRKGILVTPIWKDEDEYKKALVKEMLGGMNGVE